MDESIAWMELGPARWLAAWFDAVRDLSAARGIASRLRVEASIVIDDIEYMGAYDDATDEILVAISATPEHMLATLLHEVAHAASNPRHRRQHGYSWRRTFAWLLAEFVGVPEPERDAARWRRVMRPYRVSRAEALDALSESVVGRSSLTISTRHIHMRTRTFLRTIAR